MTDLTELRRLAEGATPGPWVAAPKEGRFGAQVDSAGCTVALCMECTRSTANATYIAAMNPVIALSLIARVERAEAEAARMREAINRALEQLASAAYKRGQEDMRERAAEVAHDEGLRLECDHVPAIGAVYARDAIRNLTIKEGHIVTDIVERLRYAHKRNMPADDRLMSEAADEITRLRADLAAAEARGMERAAVIAESVQPLEGGEHFVIAQAAAAIRAAAGEIGG